MNCDEYTIIRELMGHIEDGSNESVTLSQDESTKTYDVRVGDHTYWGLTLLDALVKARNDRA